VSPTPYQISLLHHTLGLSEQRRESYRNHFVAGHGHSDMRHLEALEQAGFMERRATPKFLDTGDIVFAVTDAGLEVAVRALPEPVKLAKAQSRYEQYCDVSECYDSFGAFLGIPEVNFEERNNSGYPDYRRVREYRMYRGSRWGSFSAEIKGEWAPTKKEAKASYKAVLKAKRESS
jgi:hypothetical protein